MEKQLFKDLDNIIQPIWRELYNRIKDYIVVGIEIKINNKNIKSVFNKYIENSEDCFSINLVMKNYAYIDYYYKNQKINPKCYYIKPKGARYVGQIDILKECLLQDTNEPNIKHLELPNK